MSPRAAKVCITVLATSVLMATGVTTAGAAGGMCSNESLREAMGTSSLLDCRAYELVSPTFKEGTQIQTPRAISADGSHVIATSLGVFAGTENDPALVGAYYEFSRTPVGWGTVPLSPSAERSPTFNFFTASADLSKSLWQLRSPTESIYASELAIREANGVFREVGPLAPPAAASGPTSGLEQGFFGGFRFAGASSGLSHILINSVESDRTFYWPGDEALPSSPSLYEYEGVDGLRPRLVGVDDSGHQLSRCGTELGGPDDKYNAISESGTTIFFTALADGCEGSKPGDGPPVNELYARLDAAQTVPISAAVGSSGGAEFLGASSDGTVVIFMVGEALYEYNFRARAGEKTATVTSGVAEPKVRGVVRVSRDGTHVYFVAESKLTGANRGGQEPEEGKNNLYVFERDSEFPAGRIAFVTTLSGEDEEDWMLPDERAAETTPDGRYLLFQSVAHITTDDTSLGRQLFEYDAENQVLTRVSIGQRAGGGYVCPATAEVEPGYNCDGNGVSLNIVPFQRPPFRAEDAPSSMTYPLAISDDGTTIVFQSKGAFAPAAAPAAEAGRLSVYEYRNTASLPGGSIADGEVSLISDGRDLTPFGTQLYGVDTTGQNVFFSSGNPLLGKDTDSQTDIYDARADGGFSEPSALPGCQGEACLGPVPPNLPASGEASSGVVGEVFRPAAPTEAQAPTLRTKPRGLVTRAQKLRRALRKCLTKPRKRRKTCEARARKSLATTHSRHKTRRRT